MINRRRIFAFLMIILAIPLSAFSLGTSILPAAVASNTSPVSWNPRVTCTPQVVRITDITANQTGSSSLAASKFNPGITTTVSGGSAKRWLTPGATPPGWVSPGPACTVTNSQGTTSLFVEIDGVERGSITVEDSANSYDPTNGGTAHATTFDNTFNVFDPAIVPNYDTSCTSPTDPTCYGRIHPEIDHDWLAAGYCGTGTFCDPSALSSQTNRTSTKIDLQGFVYWDPGNLDGGYHQYNGWELHPLTAWKLSSSPPPVSPMSASFTSSPSVPQIGQNVAFNANVTGGTPPYSFSWNFGDGVTATGGTTSHMYLAPNEYTVALTVKDAQGNSAKAQKAVAVGSWNSAVACAPAQTTLEKIIGNVPIQRIPTNPNSNGTDYTGGGFRLDGNLSYGANPTTWPFFKKDLHPPCSVNGTPAFVEFHNVTVVGRSLGNCGTTYTTDNGGGPYPNGWQSCDITFNLVTPGFGDDSTCPKCYLHRVYAGIDGDWNASGVAPLPAPAEGERIDVQGFVFWSSVFVNASFHDFSGWDIHAISAWRPTQLPLALSLSYSPSKPTPGQTITFNATATRGTGPYTFTWDFGDGTTGTGNQTTHSYGPGTFSVHVSATDSLGKVGVTSQSVLVKSIQDITLSASPSSLIVPPGMSNTTSIVVTGLGGFSGNVSLSALAVPAGLSVSLKPTTVSLTMNGSGNLLLTASATPTTPAGVYNVTITGTSGALQKSVLVHATVPGFSLSASGRSLAMSPGSSVADSITLASVSGFHGTVNLNTGPAPGGVHLNINPNNVILSAGGKATSLLTVSTDSNLLAGNYTLTVLGSAAGTSQTLAIRLTVTSDFTVWANPTSLTIPSGTSKNIQINVKSLGFKGTVTLSASASPTGLTVTLNPVTLSFNPGETHNSNLAVMSSTAGSYTVLVTARSGSIVHSTQVLVNISDFSISASPTSISLKAGSSASSTVTLTSLDGFTGNVNLPNPQTPGGIHVNVNPGNVALTAGGTGSAVVTISTDSNLLPGTYTIQVKGTIGNLAHTVNIVVTVT